MAKRLLSMSMRSSACARFVLSLPTSFLAYQTRRWLYSHASRRVATHRGFMRNRIRPITKSRTFPVVRNARESNGERSSGPLIRGEKRGKNPTRGYDFS